MTLALFAYGSLKIEEIKETWGTDSFLNFYNSVEQQKSN